MMSTPTPPTGPEPDVIVVGGAIGGLSAAFALTRQGLRVRVLERAREFGEVGAGMQIAPNCTRILDEYGLLGEAKTLGVLPANMVMRDAVRAGHCRRVVLTARKWGDLWHLDGARRRQRNAILRARDTYDYSFTDWIYGPTALTPAEEPDLYREIPLASAAQAVAGAGPGPA